MARPPSTYEGRQHRGADALRHRERFVPAAGDAVARLPEPQLVDQHGEPLPVLGEVNGVGRRAEDRNARLLQRGGQLQRRLPAELDDDADQLAPRLLDMQYLEHILDRSEEHTSELQSLMRISYAVFCLTQKTT